jgi:hypothetical protein
MLAKHCIYAGYWKISRRKNLFPSPVFNPLCMLHSDRPMVVSDWGLREYHGALKTRDMGIIPGFDKYLNSLEILK